MRQRGQRCGLKNRRYGRLPGCRSACTARADELIGVLPVRSTMRQRARDDRQTSAAAKRYPRRRHRIAHAGAPGGSAGVRRTGDGPLVVCLPGMGELRSSYRYTVPVLTAAGYRVATMDLRGHGDSDATFSRYDDVAAGQDALALIDHLGGPAVLVGNSMAAGASVWAAAEQPGAITGLALLGPFVRNSATKPLKVLIFKAAMSRPWAAKMWISYPGQVTIRTRSIPTWSIRSLLVSAGASAGFMREHTRGQPAALAATMPIDRLTSRRSAVYDHRVSDRIDAVHPMAGDSLPALTPISIELRGYPRRGTVSADPLAMGGVDEGRLARPRVRRRLPRIPWEIRDSVPLRTGPARPSQPGHAPAGGDLALTCEFARPLGRQARRTSWRALTPDPWLARAGVGDTARPPGRGCVSCRGRHRRTTTTLDPAARWPATRCRHPQRPRRHRPHRHRRDDSRPVRAIQYHQFEQVRGAVRAEYQIAERILADLIDGQCVHECVLNVLRVEAVPQRRREHLHRGIGLRSCGPCLLDTKAHPRRGETPPPAAPSNAQHLPIVLGWIGTQVSTRCLITASRVRECRSRWAAGRRPGRLGSRCRRRRRFAGSIRRPC
jgi:pimeloyl-ACP methyl ester carboxylesterase